MKELVEAIQSYGVGIGNDIVKVDMFLNHRIDTDLLVKMGQSFHDIFADAAPDIILTVEASGIAIATAVAITFNNIPVVFAKKSATKNATDAVYEAPVYSYTHGKLNHVRVATPYLPPKSRVLIVDDFLANGEAVLGLCSLVEQADSTVVGVGICVEKGFQPGRSRIEAAGYSVSSLATIISIENGKLLVRD